jgi:hypothetical protein
VNAIPYTSSLISTSIIVTKMEKQELMKRRIRRFLKEIKKTNV